MIFILIKVCCSTLLLLVLDENSMSGFWWSTKLHFTTLHGISDTFPCCRVPQIRLPYVTFTWPMNRKINILLNLNFTVFGEGVGVSQLLSEGPLISGGRYFRDLLAAIIFGHYCRGVVNLGSLRYDEIQANIDWLVCSIVKNQKSAKTEEAYHFRSPFHRIHPGILRHRYIGEYPGYTIPHLHTRSLSRFRKVQGTLK